MELNLQKTKMMIFNFTDKHQFTTELSVNNEKIKPVNETKLLGTIISSDLKWEKIH